MAVEYSSEKAEPQSDVRSADSPTNISTDNAAVAAATTAAAGEAPLTGWKYRSFKIAGFTVPHYASPQAQLLLVSFVCFLCPGKPY